MSGHTIARCGDQAPHEHHLWTPEPRVINGPKRCPGGPTADEAYDRLHGVDGHDQAKRLEAYVAEYVNDSPAALRVLLTEAQWNALEMARKADLAERRAEEAEFHVEQLRDARDSAERFNEALAAEVGRLKGLEDVKGSIVAALMAVMRVVEEYESCGPKQQSTGDVLAAVRAAAQSALDGGAS